MTPMNCIVIYAHMLVWALQNYNPALHKRRQDYVIHLIEYAIQLA